jgi:hypothetical protein
MESGNVNEGFVSLKFKGHFNPHDITNYLGICPTAMLMKGSGDSFRILPKLSFWEYAVEGTKGGLVDIYDLSNRLVTELQPLSNRIIFIKNKIHAEVVLQVALWITYDGEVPTPAIGFDVKVINFLAELGASVDIDTYRK